MMIQGEKLHLVGNTRDIGEGKISRVKVEGRQILVIKKEDEVYAIGPVCGEGCGPLCDGTLEGFCIRCPWYHEYYDIRNGRPLGVAHCKTGIKTYKTRVSKKNGDIFLEVND